MLKRKNSGFTLIELLVVVLIIGILAAIALPQYTRAVEKTRSSQMISDMNAMQRAIDMYILANGSFPSTDSLFDIMESELSSGEKDGSYYKTDYFWYWPMSWTGGGEIFVYREDRNSATTNGGKYSVYITRGDNSWGVSGNFPAEYKYMQDHILDSIRSDR